MTSTREIAERIIVRVHDDVPIEAIMTEVMLIQSEAEARGRAAGEEKMRAQAVSAAMSDHPTPNIAELRRLHAEAKLGTLKYVPAHVAEGPSQVRVKAEWLLCELPSDTYAELIVAAVTALPALLDLAERPAESEVEAIAKRLEHDAILVAYQKPPDIWPANLMREAAAMLRRLSRLAQPGQGEGKP